MDDIILQKPGQPVLGWAGADREIGIPAAQLSQPFGPAQGGEVKPRCFPDVVIAVTGAVKLSKPVDRQPGGESAVLVGIRDRAPMNARGGDSAQGRAAQLAPAQRARASILRISLRDSQGMGSGVRSQIK